MTSTKVRPATITFIKSNVKHNVTFIYHANYNFSTSKCNKIKSRYVSLGSYNYTNVNSLQLTSTHFGSHSHTLTLYISFLSFSYINIKKLKLHFSVCDIYLFYKTTIVITAMNANFLTFVSGRLSEASLNETFTEFLDYMRATYPGEFDTAYFTMSYIHKYKGGHVMFSDKRLANALLGCDSTGSQKLRQPYIQVELDIPTIITLMEQDYVSRSRKLVQQLADNAAMQEGLLSREDEWKSGALSEGMSILVCEEDTLRNNLELMTYYCDLDIAALQAKHRLNQGNETKEDLELVAKAEEQRIVPVNVMVRLPDLETISFTPTQVKMFNTDTVYSRPAPGWITNAQVNTAFNRLLDATERHKTYTVNGFTVKSPLVHRKPHGDQAIFKVQFLGNTPTQDLSYAMLTSTFITFEHNNINASVKFEPTGCARSGGGEQLWNSSNQPHPPHRKNRR